MRKLFGIFILSVACCMIAGADMLLFAKTETYQLMFFGGYAVSALLLVLLGLLCARDRRLYSLGMTIPSSWVARRLTSYKNLFRCAHIAL